MRGRHEIIVRNMRIQYKFAIERNITILRGDSATGKTTMIEMVAAYQRSGEQSGVTIRADRPCVVLTELNWQMQLSLIHDSIILQNMIYHAYPLAAMPMFFPLLSRKNIRPCLSLLMGRLSGRSEETFLKYTKARLNPNYLQPKIAEKIERLLPQMDGLSFGDV